MIEIEIDSKYNIRRLQSFLSYELSSSILLIFSFMWGLAIEILAVAALLFTPFMLKVLFDERKYGWITFFFLLVLFPAVIVFFIDIEPAYKLVLYTIPLVLFYFYCFVLRLAIPDW